MLRAVMAGCGAMSRGWLRAINETPDLRQRVSVVGLVDLNFDSAQALAMEFGLSDVISGTDLGAVLNVTKPDVLFDIVIPGARAGVVETGLRHGCHVLSEKPMATDLAEARGLIQAAAQAKRIHAIVQNRRYIPGVRRLRRAIEQGLIGDVTAVHCDFFIGAHFGGFREDMGHVLLLDMAVHTFDAARFVIGKEPLAVYCQESNPVGSWYRQGAAANALFDFDGGAVFTYRGSWCAEGANTSWESRWRVVGSNGTILWDGLDHFEAGGAGKGQGLLREPVKLTVPEPPEPADVHGHASVIATFVRAVETGAMPETAATDNIKSLAMVLAAIESAETGRRVDIVTEETK